tara:strand:- start:289 stop:906 length:618 start_codon:yes stop_codon:yes gene_type:complete
MIKEFGTRLVDWVCLRVPGHTIEYANFLDTFYKKDLNLRTRLALDSTEIVYVEGVLLSNSSSAFELYNNEKTFDQFYSMVRHYEPQFIRKVRQNKEIVDNFLEKTENTHVAELSWRHIQSRITANTLKDPSLYLLDKRIILHYLFLDELPIALEQMGNSSFGRLDLTGKVVAMETAYRRANKIVKFELIEPFIENKGIVMRSNLS